MIEIIQLIKELGSSAIDLFWLPVAIWTGLALIAALIFKYSSSLSAVYQYHFRVAVLAALPAGILAAPVIQALLKTGEAGVPATLFVIQNPIPVTVASAAESGINWTNPAFWIGAATVLAALIALSAIVKLFIDYLKLEKFIRKLDDKKAVDKRPELDAKIYFTEEIENALYCRLV